MTAPKLPWCVLNMDDGLIRRERTRKEAVQWCLRAYDGRVLSRHTFGPGAYAYTIGYPDGDRAEYLSIEHEDAARRQSWDGLDGEPLYPHRDDPHLRRTAGHDNQNEED